MKLKFTSVILLIVASFIFLNSCSKKGECNYLAVKLDDSNMWSIIDLDTEKIIAEDEFEYAPSIIVDDIFFVKNYSNTYDYYNVADVKTPINKESFISVSAFAPEGVALAVKPGERIALIDKNCNTITHLPKEIAECGAFYNGLAVFRTNDHKYGFIDTSGEIIIGALYDAVSAFSHEGIALTKATLNDTTTKIFAINNQGEKLFLAPNSDFSLYSPIHEGYFAFIDKDDVYLYNDKGEKGIKFSKSKNLDINNTFIIEDKIIFSDGINLGIKDKNGNIILAPKYDYLEPIDNDRYIALKNKKYGLIDSNDNIIIPFENHSMKSPNPELLIVGKTDDKLFSLYNSDGDILTNLKISDISLDEGNRVCSNYFDATGVALELFRRINNGNCFRGTPTSTLADFKDKLPKHKKDLSLTYRVEEYVAPYYVNYYFENPLTRTISDNSTSSIDFEYNYDNPLTSVEYFFSITNYPNSSEKQFEREFDRTLFHHGYRKDFNNKYVNERIGTAISYGYVDGNISIRYYFNSEDFKKANTRKFRN